MSKAGTSKPNAANGVVNTARKVIGCVMIVIDARDHRPAASVRLTDAPAHSEMDPREPRNGWGQKLFGISPTILIPAIISAARTLTSGRR